MDNEYVFEILSLGCCPALVPGAWFSDGADKLLVWDTEGLTNLYMAASGICLPAGRVFGLPFVLDLTCMALNSVYTAEDWLIPAGMLDMSCGGAWVEADTGLVRFKLRNDAADAGPADVDPAGRAAAQLASGICSASGLAAADIAARKLQAAAETGASVKDLASLAASLRLLTRMV